MAEIPGPFIVTGLLLIALYFISRISLRQMTGVGGHRLLAIFFLPGTIFHEMAHAVAAFTLLLHVREVAILPKVEKHRLVLGYVSYDKADPFRALLVGLAPFFAGIIILLFIPSLGQVLGNNLASNLAVSYLVFNITTMMFFSESDVEQAYLVVPLIFLILGSIFYVFNLRIEPEWVSASYDYLAKLGANINGYLFFSLILHLFFIILVRRRRS